MNPNELSGPELLRHVVNGDLPHPTMAGTIPMKMVSIEKDKVIDLMRSPADHDSYLDVFEILKVA